MLNNIDRQGLDSLRSRIQMSSPPVRLLPGGLRLSLLANGFGNSMGLIEERMREAFPNYQKQEQSNPYGLVSNGRSFVTVDVWEMG
jgi:hypothetical protein